MQGHTPRSGALTCSILGKDSSVDGQSPAALLGFKPKTVSPEQVSDALSKHVPVLTAESRLKQFTPCSPTCQRELSLFKYGIFLQDTDRGCFSDNIRYDLLRTGSVQLTSNKILERGFLPAVCPP